MGVRKERYTVEIILIVIVIMVIVGVIISVFYSETKSNDLNPNPETKSNDLNPDDKKSNSGKKTGKNTKEEMVKLKNPPQTQKCQFTIDENTIFKDKDKIPALGDGNCFFHAVLYGLKCLGIYNGNHTQLRKELCDFMSNDYESIAYISDNIELDTNLVDNFSDNVEYVNNMRNNGEWATNIELYCLSLMFQTKCCFCLYELNTQKNYDEPLVKITTFSPDINSRLPIINIYNADGKTHYDSLPIYKPSL